MAIAGLQKKYFDVIRLPSEPADWCVRYVALLFIVLNTALPWPSYTWPLPALIFVLGNRWRGFPFAITALCAIMLVHLFGFAWSSVDNHRFLFLYWVLALTLTSWLPAGERASAIQRHARVLILLAFTAATVAKLRSPEFGDGTFLTHLLLTKSRMQTLADLVGITAADKSLYAAAIAKNHLPECLREAAGCATTVPPNLAVLLISWMGIAIEALVATSFLFFQRVSKFAHLTLVLFIGITYLLVPVYEFGFVLTAIGLGAAVDSTHWSRAYLGCALWLCVLQTIF